MTEEEWLAAVDSDDLINHFVEKSGLEAGPDAPPRVPEGAMNKRKLCLFYCGCFRIIWPVLNAGQQETTALLEAKAEEPEFSTDEYGYDEYFARRLGADAAGQAHLLRDIFGNPFRSVSVDPSWLTSDVRTLAEGIYADRAFDRMPILADALQDAGCDNEDLLNHCRGPGPHVRGCWMVDLVLGKV